ncbi:MAG: hypothetical protein KC620_00080 [Myxococcales bacterium]|nr:hypothetical protein [Myxococcales bacterium]
MRRTFLLAALLSGCAFGSSHLDEVDPEAAPATPTWSAHVLPILEHRCTACHADDALPGKAAGYGFGTCAEAKRHWGELYETAFIELSMPPGGAPRLESWEMLTLQRWHDQGGRCD